MSILQQQASDVRIQEINLSQVITSASSSVACQIVVSTQGPTKPTYFTNAQDYLAAFGNPNPAVGFDVYCALNYFSEGNQLWAARCVHSDALWSTAIMYLVGTVTSMQGVTAGVPDPTNPLSWTALPPSPSDPAIALFYPINGQGSYANNLAISITTTNIGPPSGVAVASSNSGGTLSAATYEYQVSALGANGETLASSPVTVVISSGSTNSNAVSWNPVPLATGYVVYGRTVSGLGELTTLGQGNYGFVDTGAITPNVAQQPITSPSNLPPPSPQFTVSVYNTLQSVSTPVETFLCTLTPGVDSSGNATELEARINPFSQYIQVNNNTPALMSVPTILNSVGLTYLAGGNSGSAPTSSDVVNAFQVFANKQLYNVNMLINGGHSTPTVQLAMDTLVQARGDSIGLLDVPSAQQTAQNAVNYRNLSLNLNSTYSALFNPDVLEADTINGTQQYVPFSGWAAALCARTDRVANPSFSPAGLNRGLVSVLKARYSYDDGAATLMFKAQVNYTRTFIGAGTALWEQQTLAAQQSALSWLSVRRIVNVIKVSLYQFLLYSLQEPNDDFTGRQIVGACTDYLQAIQNARGISSFTVVSDSSNNTAAMFNSGIRTVTVVIVPVIPIHEIDLQVVISKQGVSFTETLSQVSGQ